MGTSETPQGSLRSGRSVKRLRSGLWFVRSGLQSGVAIRLDIILSSAPAARFSGFATLDGATLASPNSWCLLVSALRSDCVERGGDLDDRVDADHGKRGLELRNREVMQDNFSAQQHLGFGGWKNRLGLPFYEIERAAISPSVGLHKWFQTPAAIVRFNSRPVSPVASSTDIARPCSAPDRARLNGSFFQLHFPVNVRRWRSSKENVRR